MSTGHQAEAVAGSGKETTWGTGVLCTRYRPMITENLSAKRTPIASKRLTGGGVGKKFLRDGPVDAAGQIVEEMLYDLTTDPIDHLMQALFGTAAGHWYRRMSNITGTSGSWIPLRNATNDNIELADIVPALAAAASAGMKVRRRLRRIGAPSGNVWNEVQTLSSSLPAGTPVTNGTGATLAAASITLDSVGEEYELGFAIDPSLVISTAYGLVLKGDYTLSATDQIQMWVENVASGGTFAIKDASYAADVTKNGVGRGLTTTFIDGYIMAKSVEGLFCTYAVDKGVAVHEFDSLKVVGLSISSKPKEGITMTWDVLFRNQAASSATTSAQLQALQITHTMPVHSDLTVLLGAQTAPLVAGDAIDSEGVEFKLTRPSDARHVSATDYIIEPRSDGERDCTLALDVPRYAAGTLKGYALNKTALQAKLQWTSGGKYRSFLLPNLRINGDVEIPTDGVKAYPQKVPMIAFANEGTNLFQPIQYEVEHYFGAA
jgi:hypothetical protein